MKSKISMASGFMAVLLSVPLAKADLNVNGTANGTWDDRATMTYDNDPDDPTTITRSQMRVWEGGSLTMTSGDLVLNSSTWDVAIGPGRSAGPGGFYQNGGNLTLNALGTASADRNKISIGQGAGSTGLFEFGGNSCINGANYFFVGRSGGIGILNLHGGDFDVDASFVGIGGTFDSGGANAFTDDATGTINIHDGTLTCSGAGVDFQMGANDIINFTSYGVGSLSINGWLESDFLALAVSGNFQVDGIVQSNLTAFTYSLDSSQGVLSAVYTAPASIPPTPVNIVASALNTDLTITWDGNFGTQYKVKHATSLEGPYAEVASIYLPPYADTLVLGSTHYYKVSAFNDLGESADSAVFTVSAIDSPPGAPSVSKLWMNGTSAKLYWEQVATATSYTVKHATSSNGPFASVESTDALQYVVSGLVADTTNYFVVTAENNIGEGDPSSMQAGVTTTWRIIGDNADNGLDPDLDRAYGDNLYRYKEATLDGDTTTYYDAAIANGWVGVDFGEGNESTVPGVDFHTAPKPSRMENGVFEGSNDFSTWDSLYTVSFTPDAGWTRIYTGSTTPYRYVRFRTVNGFGNVAELNFLTAADLPTNAPPTVTNLVAHAAGQNVHVSWDLADGAISYAVERDSGGGFTAHTNVSGTAFVDIDQDIDSTYSYRVTATNLIGSAATSAEESATTYKYLVLGSEPYGGNVDNAKGMAYDADAATFADLILDTAGDGASWHGLDYGSGATKVLREVRLNLRDWTHSVNFASFARIQGANSVDFSDAETLHVIGDNTLNPAGTWNTLELSNNAAAYQYVRIIGFEDAAGLTNGNCGFVADIQFLTSEDYTASGTPFWWIDENGLPEDDTIDTDSDGASNAKEYLAGTDPNDPNSVLAFTNTYAEGVELIMTWDSIAGKTYNVLTSGSLTFPSWVIDETVIATDSNTSYTGSVSEATQQFYGIEVE